jgi:hypothetical protein
MKAIEITAIDYFDNDVKVELQNKNTTLQTLHYSKRMIAETLNYECNYKGVFETSDGVNHIGEYVQDTELIDWLNFEFHDSEIKKFLIKIDVLCNDKEVEEWENIEEISKARLKNFVERLQHSENPVKNIEAEMMINYLLEFGIDLFNKN